jgi:hypothetical protein
LRLYTWDSRRRSCSLTTVCEPSTMPTFHTLKRNDLGWTSCGLFADR